MPSASNAPTFSGSVGSQGKSRVLEHVVEREEAAEQHFLRSVPSVTDVLGGERAVDPASEDPAHLPALELLLGGDPPLEQGPDEPKGLPAIDPEPGGELGAGEHAAVETRQRDPLGLAPRPPERLERVSRVPARWAIIAAAP